MTSRRLLSSILLLTICLTLFPLARPVSAAGDVQGYYPWALMKGHTGVIQGDQLYYGNLQSELRVAELKTYKVPYYLPLDAPLANLQAIGVQDALYGITQAGTLYSIDIKNIDPVEKYHLALAPVGADHLWPVNQISNICWISQTTACVIIGDTLYAVDLPNQRIVWKKSFPQNSLVADIQQNHDRLIVAQKSGSGQEIVVLKTDGSECFQVSAGLARPSIDDNAVSTAIYYAGPDGSGVWQVDILTGQKQQAFATSTNVTALSIGSGHLYIHQGSVIDDMYLSTAQVMGRIEEEAPSFSYYGGETTLRTISNSAVSEYQDRKLIWAAEFANYADAKIVYQENKQLIVRVSAEYIAIYLPTAYAPVSGTLAFGQTQALTFDHPEEGMLSWNVNLSKLNYNFALSYTVQALPTGATQWTQLGGGRANARGASFYDANVPVGKVQITLSPIPRPGYDTAKNPQVAVDSQMQYSFTLGRGITPNTGAMPTLKMVSPNTHYDIWAGQSISSVDLQVQAAPLTDVAFFGSDQVQRADQQGIVQKQVLLGDQPVTTIIAYVTGPSAHMALVTTVVYRHLVTQDPRVGPTLSRQPAVILQVPDASLVDLSASSMQIAGKNVPLYANLANNTIFGVPESSLPTGSLTVDVSLNGKANLSGENPLLDQITWPLQVIGYRQAELWPNKVESILNGEKITLDTAPFIDKASSSTMLPFRYIGDVMGASVAWNATTKEVSFKLKDKTVVLTIGQKTAHVNGQPIQMRVAPTIINSRTFLPLRFMSENLGASVNWDAKARQVTIQVWEDPQN